MGDRSGGWRRGQWVIGLVGGGEAGRRRGASG